MTSSRRPATALDAESLLTHGAWLARLARALVARDDEIEDVVQQTYAQALDRPPRHAQNVRGWLGTIARNVVRSNARSSSARVAREIAVPAPPPVESPVEAVERAELRRMVVESVLALDEPYRSTVILRFFEEQEVAVIARLTDAGEDTVRTRIRRGVVRVRELLERKVDAGARGAADEGAAARALLFLRLREIAAGNGGGGATGSAAAARGLGRAGATSAGANTLKRFLAGATTAAVVGVATLGWWMASRSEDRVAESPTTTRDSSASRPESSPPAPTPAVADRRDEATPATAIEASPPPPSSRFARSGTILGRVTDAGGRPVAGANVWAIASPAHKQQFKMPDFGTTAQQHAEQDPRLHEVGDWIATVSGDDGRYQFTGLSRMPAWEIGAYHPDHGAMISKYHAMSRGNDVVVEDVELLPGAFVRGIVRDEEGVPVGGAKLRIILGDEKKTPPLTFVAYSWGKDAGRFDVGFQCGAPLEIQCRAPGYLTSPRVRVDTAAGANARDLELTLQRRPGSVARGRIVDPDGEPFDLQALLETVFPTSYPDELGVRATVRAISTADGFEVVAGVDPPKERVVDGRIDFAEGEYEVVAPAGFEGRLELRLDRFVVGARNDFRVDDPDDLVCDDSHVPTKQPTIKLPVRFVDARTKLPINLEGEVTLPLASYGDSFASLLRKDSDRARGLLVWACDPGRSLKIEQWIGGYVTSVFPMAGPDREPPEPLVLEIPPADAGVRGTVLHASGEPCVYTPLMVFQPTPSGFVDVTGFPVVTNPDGDFEIAALAQGEHWLVVLGNLGEANAVVRFDASDPFPELEVRFIPGAPTRFRLRTIGSSNEAAETHFRIFDEHGLMVENLNRDPALRGSANEFAVTLAPGPYTIRVEREGCREATIRFTVPTDDRIEIPLEPAAPQSR